MAIQLLNVPNSTNVAYTRLLYTLSGSIYTGEPQFQYICDVYESGSNQIIKRMAQPVNPAGTATFDVARILQGELSADYNWKMNSATSFNSSSRVFRIEVGEQFGTSTSSSITAYPGQLAAALRVNQGVVEPNAGNYNLPLFGTMTLSNMPSTMSMQSDDFGTISVLNYNDIIVSQSFYSASSITGTYDLVDQKNYDLSSTNSSYDAVPISSSANYWNYVDVSVSGSYGTQTYRYEASDETHREKTRFAFVNKLGAWDYYNNYNPVKQRINVTRQEYTAPRVDYSSRRSSEDISRRGKTVNDSTTDDQFTTDTDYLNKTNANWLEELIESPEVYIQRNGEFIPVVITDTSYTSKTSASRQKLFKYTINFKPSNQPFGTWIPEYVQCPKQPTTTLFDPTLDGEITPYFWYDFSDTGSMIPYGTGSNEYEGIVSKGTNTGSLVRGDTNDYPEKYDSPYWEPFTYNNFLAQFNPSGGTNEGKNSTIVRANDPSSSYLDDTIFYTGSQITAITVTSIDNWSIPAIGSETQLIDTYQALISIRQPATIGNQIEELNLFGLGTSGSFDPPVGTSQIDFVSSNTVDFISASYLEYEINRPSPSAERNFVVYSYSGSSPNSSDIQTTYMVYNSGSNNGFAVGREPISSSQNFITSSIIFENGDDAIAGENQGLSVGTRSGGSYLPGGSFPPFLGSIYPFKVGQIILYDSILSNDQIQRVIDNYKASVPFGGNVNRFEN